MSIDLSYPLISSMGKQDPLDGFVTYNELQATAGDFKQLPQFDLSTEITDMSNICHTEADPPMIPSESPNSCLMPQESHS